MQLKYSTTTPHTVATIVDENMSTSAYTTIPVKYWMALNQHLLSIL